MNKKGNKPKCVPLCHPDNFEWDKGKATLVKKRKRRGKLVVCEAALEIISAIDGPICPIAVTGPARCGKSYIASQLLEPRPYDCVFQTSSKMLPETMGIWMSTDFYKKTLANGTEVTVMIMDTEGLGAYDAYNQDDMQMFTLMALLSSVLVYNSKGSLTAEDIKKLSWVGTLRTIIQGNGDGGVKKSKEGDFIRFFPNFMWLLRDVSMTFTLMRDDDEEEEVDIREYILQEVLKLEKETPMTEKKVKEYNDYRRALLRSFPVFDAYKLPMPALDPKVLAKMDKGKNRDRLSRSFVDEVDGFIERCALLMKPKKAWPYSGNIHGRQFAELLKQYVSEFGSPGGVLNINTVGAKVIETLLIEVTEEAYANYSRSMAEFIKSVVPCQNHVIITQHNDCRFKAMRNFEAASKYIRDADRLHMHRRELKARIAEYSDDGHTCVGGNLHAYLELNAKKSEAFCKKLVHDLLDENLHPLVALSKEGSDVDVSTAVQQVERLYKEKARGPQMWHVYKTLLADKINMFLGVMSTFSRTSKEETQQKIAHIQPTVRKTAEEQEIKEKEKTENEFSEMKKKEEEHNRETLKRDIEQQQKQTEVDNQEISAAILSQVALLLRSHADLAKELEQLKGQLAQETKTVREELDRKKETLA